MRTRSSRRLAALGLTGLVLLAGGVSACGDKADDTKAAGPVELRFSWWGNNDRAKATQQIIDAFQAKYPNIKVKGEPTDFNSYFDKLGTAVAAGDAPDVITLGGAYTREYGDRGALLDLAKVKAQLKTDKIAASALSNGNFSRKQFGVPTGVNSFAIAVDPEIFKKAGVDLPDDTRWTWDDLISTAKALQAKLPKGSYALPDPTRTDILDLYSRQKGESLYTDDGKLNISKQTLVDWWTMTTGLRDAGATPPAATTAELATQPAPEQSLLGRGLAGMQFEWSNLIGALRKASGHPLTMLRAPGETGGKQPGMWLQAAQIYSINAKTKHPKEAAMFVDFLVNSADAGKIVLTDRGIPANSDVLAAILPALNPDQQEQAKFIDRVAKGAGPALVIGPKGSTDIGAQGGILQRLNQEVLFNKRTPADAADEFIKQSKAAINR